MSYTTRQQAILLLADGTIFYGKSIGIEGTTFGELCFNTGMTGYQEVFTDPSYFGQIMIATNAHVGNYGVNETAVEADKIMISGPTTGNQELILEKMFVEGKETELAKVGDKVTFEVPFRVRLSDKLFKVLS